MGKGLLSGMCMQDCKIVPGLPALYLTSVRPTCSSIWSTTKTSKENPSFVLNACASLMLRPRSLCMGQSHSQQGHI